MDRLSVVFAIAFAVLFLHEPLTWPKWVGGALVVGESLVLAYGG